MKLKEVAYIIGDDGGIHHHLDKAVRNMEHHGKKHKAAHVRDLCTKAAEQIKNSTRNPAMMFDDPHTFIKLMSMFHGEPDESSITQALVTLGSYSSEGS